MIRTANNIQAISPTQKIIVGTSAKVQGQNTPYAHACMLVTLSITPVRTANG